MLPVYCFFGSAGASSELRLICLVACLLLLVVFFYRFVQRLSFVRASSVFFSCLLAVFWPLLVVFFFCYRLAVFCCLLVVFGSIGASSAHRRSFCLLLSVSVLFCCWLFFGSVGASSEPCRSFLLLFV